MRDCENARMRDLLPDLLHDRLPGDVRVEVEAHVRSCVDCRAEVELLRRVQAAVVAPAIDAAKVSARVPAYRPRSAPALSAANVWSVATHSWPLRAAAAIVLVVGAASLLRDRVGRVDSLDTTFATAAAAAAAAAAASGTELAVGSLTDLKDADLETLLAGMARLEAVTPSEPDVIVVPAVRSGSEP